MRWKDHNSSHDSWLPSSSIPSGARALVAAFNKRRTIFSIPTSFLPFVETVIHRAVTPANRNKSCVFCDDDIPPSLLLRCSIVGCEYIVHKKFSCSGLKGRPTADEFAKYVCFSHSLV